MKKLIAFFVIVLFIVITSEVDAIRQSGSYGGGSHPTPPPTQPIMPVVKPMKLQSQIIDEFVKASGVKIISQRDNVYEFEFGDGLVGTIVVYEQGHNIRKEHQAILDRNTSGLQYTWSYAKRRILLILPSETSEETAKEFEEIVYGIYD